MKNFSLTGWCNLKLFFGLVILLFLTSIAGATVPRLLTLQGRITDPTTGNPVADGTYRMVFGIYESEMNGSALWAETTDVPVQAGTFNVYLHPPDPNLPPDPVFNDTGVRYLGIQVLPDPELSPRIRLASVPYSFKVRTVEGALGGNIFGDLQLHSTLTVGDLAGDVGRLEITDGASTKIVADGATGNVGIGTTTPTAKLHVVGPSQGLVTLEALQPFLVLNATTPNTRQSGLSFQKLGTRNWEIFVDAGGFDLNNLNFRDVIAGQTRLFIDPSGNVGIGTTSPASELHVKASGANSGNLRLESGQGTTFDLDVLDLTQINLGATSNVPLHLMTNATNRLTISEAGNVGIGTTTPLSQLEVYDDNTVEYGLRVDKVATGGNSQAVSAFNSAAPAAGFASHGGFFKASSNVSTGIFTKKVGVRGQAEGTGSDNIAGWFQASGATDNYAIYADLGKNYFAENVGIGTASPGNILTVVVGSATDPIADAWNTYSSAEYKQGIRELSQEEYSEALQKLLATPVVKYRYKGQSFMDKEKIGIVIEEAPEEIVAEGNTKAASLNEYISLLHAALKAQQAQLENQQAEIKTLIEEMKQLIKEE